MKLRRLLIRAGFIITVVNFLSILLSIRSLDDGAVSQPVTKQEKLASVIDGFGLEERKDSASPTFYRKEDLNISPILSKTRVGFEENDFNPLLTLFTTWNDNPQKYLVHNLTTHNWLYLKPFVIPIVFTNDSSIAKVCEQSGWVVYDVPVAAADGVPVLKYMYLHAMERYDSHLYAYSNSDIIFTGSLLNTLYTLINNHLNINEPCLVVGGRTDVDILRNPIGYSWSNITKVASKAGVLHRDVAVDYFITTRSFPWKDFPPVVVGRLSVDEFLLYYCRKANYTVIDVTKTVLAVHQSTAAGNNEGYGHQSRFYNLNNLMVCINILGLYANHYIVLIGLHTTMIAMWSYHTEKPMICYVNSKTQLRQDVG